MIYNYNLCYFITSHVNYFKKKKNILKILQLDLLKKKKNCLQTILNILKEKPQKGNKSTFKF